MKQPPPIVRFQSQRLEDSYILMINCDNKVQYCQCTQEKERSIERAVYCLTAKRWYVKGRLIANGNFGLKKMFGRKIKKANCKFTSYSSWVTTQTLKIPNPRRTAWIIKNCCTNTTQIFTIHSKTGGHVFNEKQTLIREIASSQKTDLQCKRFQLQR